MECYSDIIYGVLSIPVIYSLYASSQLRVEIKKRERDVEYCKNDIMESETMRYYISTESYKQLVRNIHGGTIIFLILIVIVGFVALVFSYLEILMVSILLFILASFLVSYVTIPENTEEYDSQMKSLKSKLKKLKPIDFNAFPKAFKNPFIERWSYLQKIDSRRYTSKQIIDDINTTLKKENNVILADVMRPLTNYFVEDKYKEPYEKKDIDYLNRLIKNKEDLVLPVLETPPSRLPNDTLEWIILLILYFQIFHKHYLDTDMIVEIITACVISILSSMTIYYTVLAKDEL